jgi:hypothetical protein
MQAPVARTPWTIFSSAKINNIILVPFRAVLFWAPTLPNQSDCHRRNTAIGRATAMQDARSLKHKIDASRPDDIGLSETTMVRMRLPDQTLAVHQGVATACDVLTFVHFADSFLVSPRTLQ